jgi:hypothetical protein
MGRLGAALFISRRADRIASGLAATEVKGL